MKTKRPFSEGLDLLHEKHAAACEAIEAMAELATKLRSAAKRDESIEALAQYIESLTAVQGHLYAALSHLGDV